ESLGRLLISSQVDLNRKFWVLQDTVRMKENDYFRNQVVIKYPAHSPVLFPRYASLYFCCAIEDQDNELLTLEVVHRYVELLDRYFGNVCELDIIFNFEKAYFILDEFIIGGEVQDTSKRSAVKAIEDSDMLQEVRLKKIKGKHFIFLHLCWREV
uniref:AP complex mu/sigma subunit domain-containing protein n=1 Tax=Pavo cristatus TaxID=9049 RepID=A0A8C9G934_PAVCR